MFVVIVTIRGKRPNVYGAFPSSMSARDWAISHQEETGQACEIRPLEAALVYGDEGL